MVAAPQYGALIFRGVSGQRYNVDLYASDVANALCNVDSGAGASSSSETFWTAPENCVLEDFYIHTGMTDTTRARLTLNNSPTSEIYRFAAHLDTSNARPLLNYGIAQGRNVRLVQLA